VRVPFHQKRFTGRKKLYSQPNHFFRSLALYHYHPPATYCLSHFLHLVSMELLYVPIYVLYIYILYPCISAAFFISRHVSKKVTLPEWHIFLAGTINSHHTKITSRTMNNGPYFYRNLSLNAPRKPYTALQYLHDGAEGGSIVPAKSSLWSLSRVFVDAAPYCYHSLLLIILVLAICRRPQSQQRNKNKDERVRFFFFGFSSFNFKMTSTSYFYVNTLNV